MVRSAGVDTAEQLLQIAGGEVLALGSVAVPGGVGELECTMQLISVRCSRKRSGEGSRARVAR